MAERKLKIGDPVLFYGKSLTVDRIEEVGDNHMLRAQVGDVEARDRRDAAIARIRELRAEQVHLSGEAHAEIAAEIDALDAVAREALFWVGIRVDLLSWWDERSVWVSEGRILSDDQAAVLKKVFGQRVQPDAQRDALGMVETIPAARFAAILSDIAADAAKSAVA